MLHSSRQATASGGQVPLLQIGCVLGELEQRIVCAASPAQIGMVSLPSSGPLYTSLNINQLDSRLTDQMAARGGLRKDAHVVTRRRHLNNQWAFTRHHLSSFNNSSTKNKYRTKHQVRQHCVFKVPGQRGAERDKHACNNDVR